MASNRIQNPRRLCDGMKGHNYGLPDCIKFIFERLNNFDDLSFWDIAALTGDTIAQVYNSELSDYREYCLSGYLAGKDYVTEVFDMLGYDIDYAVYDEAAADKEKYAVKISDYIDRGIPVLVKTNLTEFFSQIDSSPYDVLTYALIVGYEREGDTLRLSLLTADKDELRCVLCDGKKLDLVFVGDKTVPKTKSDVILTALNNAVGWLTYPENDGRYIGVAAYRRWAEDIRAGRFTDENLRSDWWSNYGVYVCNLATSGSALPALCRGISTEAGYEGYKALADELFALLPTENSDGTGRSRLWIDLEDAEGGMDMGKVKATMEDSAKREIIADILDGYADRLERAVGLLRDFME